MNNYWVGVFIGLCCSIVLTSIIGFCCLQEVRGLKQQQAELEQRQKVLEDWYKENETVMQTYKFFNQSWQAIIDLRNEDESNLH